MSYPTTREEALGHICLSADYPDKPTLMSNLKRLPSGMWVKIDQLMTKRDGPEVVREVVDMGFNVFSDEKVTEVPSKLAEIAKVCASWGPTMLNCMAGSLSSLVWEHPDPAKLDGLKQFADVCHGAGVRPCAVTVLTSKTPGAIEGEFAGRSSLGQVDFYVDVLRLAGFTDVVCSTKELPIVGLNTNVPGIVMPDGDSPDQARTDTPSGALNAGADMMVIGRALTKGDIEENLDAIVAEILAGAPAPA